MGELKVKLADIVSAIEEQSDTSETYLNRITGEILMINDEEGLMLSGLEDTDEESDKELPEWQQEIKQSLVHFTEHSEEYIALPDKVEINDWQIMYDFAAKVEDDQMREELMRALHGKGAFRYFKNTADRFGLLNEWFEYRHQTYLAIARDWCTENGIVPVE